MNAKYLVVRCSLMIHFLLTFIGMDGKGSERGMMGKSMKYKLANQVLSITYYIITLVPLTQNTL